ncbi:unnamed protein product [Auanema sp. JU1783]|nr:unnamed protein product [Auanema sp. JU1783]
MGRGTKRTAARRSTTNSSKKKNFYREENSDGEDEEEQSKDDRNQKDDEDFVLDPKDSKSPESPCIDDDGEEGDAEDADELDEEITNKTKSKGSKKALTKRLESKDNAEPSTSSNNFNPDRATPYMAYDPLLWNPQFLYRLPSDITLGAIRESGGEGLGRIEIGHRLSMDSTTKAGNRRVSAFIVNVCNDRKDYVGQFQKMEGKIRCIKYFWKANSQPERFIKLFEDFQKITGVPCPFKMGQVIKFANSKLSTLRISDVTLRRLNDLMETLNHTKVIVTMQRTLRIIEEKEKAIGYHFAIDKKSLMKCIKALEDVSLVRLLETTVSTPDNVPARIQLLCHKDITSVDDSIVRYYIEKTIEEYVQQGRVFPHGQLRYSAKKRAEFNELGNEKSSDCGPIIIENGITFQERYRLFRNQTSRAIVGVQEEKNCEVVDNVDDLNNTLDSQEDMTMDEGRDGFTLDTHADIWTSVELGGDKKLKINSEMAQRFGYQMKVMRWFIMHELAYNMVYSKKTQDHPSVYERFPPLDDPSHWPERNVEDIPTYCEKDSPFVFVPPVPPFRDLGPGYFMLIDLVRALPLSMYVLCAYVGKTVPRPLLNEYLSDPGKRHVCVGDLPLPLRMPILRDKRLYRQLEHIFLSLGVLGLVALVKNPDPKRFLSHAASVFYVSKKGVLHDTSSSEKGYATVTLPISRYDKYDYEFESENDVSMFWHHLRAIVHSTPLSFRSDCEPSDSTKHKKYSLGVFDKASVTIDPEQEIVLYPLEPNDGCAGFDSSLFLHLRRHWELNPRPSVVTHWFIERFRRQSDAVKRLIESRVSSIQQDWNSYVKILMPSDVDLNKSKRIRAATYSSTRSSIGLESKSKLRVMRKGIIKKKKRPLDTVDMVSEQARLHVRSRFNSKERDMLILIRAIGFFLNPVYRFWLDPAVLRDIMHEYVPESRSKTVQSLMAAGVREMVRPNRLAYLQRIVRNLATFPEMRKLRVQLANSPLSTSEAKTVFFKEAFQTANQLLFMENQTIPSANSPNSTFEDYLLAGKVVIASEQSSSHSLPLRSRKPTNLEHIHHCVAINILLSILIHTTDGSFSDCILEQISPTVIYGALQVLRSDGLVSKTRKLDPKLLVVTKDQSVPSYYFRHFFAHRFHSDIVEKTARVYHESLEAYNSSAGPMKLDGDEIGLVIAAAGSYVGNSDLDIKVDDSMLSVFEEIEAQRQSTKQIRYLENADLRLEEIEILLTHKEKTKHLARLDDLFAALIQNKTQPIDVKQSPLAERLKDISNKTEKNELISIYDAISSSKEIGVGLKDLEVGTKISSLSILKRINVLLSLNLIIEIGVDCRRWVALENADAWTVKVNQVRVCPRPWTLPNGTVCESTVRWMSESVLMLIIANPGIPMRDIRFRYEFAVQPAVVEDILSLLENAECIKIKEEKFESMTLFSPFAKVPSEEVFVYVVPAPDCFERFSRIFSDVSFLPSMLGGSRPEEEVTVVSRTIEETAPKLVHVDVKQEPKPLQE